MVRETTTVLDERLNQASVLSGNFLHVTRILCVEHAPRQFIAKLDAVFYHLGSQSQHFTGDLEDLIHNRGGAFFLS